MFRNGLDTPDTAFVGTDSRYIVYSGNMEKRPATVVVEIIISF